MPTLSAASAAVLNTCTDNLRLLFFEVIKGYDYRALIGARSEAEEMENIRLGKSHLKDPLNSTHVVSDRNPKSRALDAAPYPVIWPNEGMSIQEKTHVIGRFYHFAGYVKGVAERLNIKIRWGGDWSQELGKDNEKDYINQTFDDLDHFEEVDDSVPQSQ